MPAPSSRSDAPFTNRAISPTRPRSRKYVYEACSCQPPRSVLRAPAHSAARVRGGAWAGRCTQLTSSARARILLGSAAADRAPCLHAASVVAAAAVAAVARPQLSVAANHSAHRSPRSARNRKNGRQARGCPRDVRLPEAGARRVYARREGNRGAARARSTSLANLQSLALGGGESGLKPLDAAVSALHTLQI